LPTYLADSQIAQGRLVGVLQDRMPEGPSLTAVYPHRRHLAGQVRALINHLVGWFEYNPVG
jgi:DNA-binding transcriptional LysR family regulator